jgi:hypothetical protein
VYQQTQRWIEAGCFEDMVHDLRELLRAAQGRKAQPSRPSLTRKQSKPLPKAGTAPVMMVIREERLQSHMAVDTLGHLLALIVTPARSTRT